MSTLASFVKENANDENQEKVLLCLVGNRSKSLIHFIVSHVKPAIIYWVCNEDEIKIMVSFQSKYTKIKHKLVLVDSRDPEEISRKIFSTLNNLVYRFGS